MAEIAQIFNTNEPKKIIAVDNALIKTDNSVLKITEDLNNLIKTLSNNKIGLEALNKAYENSKQKVIEIDKVSNKQIEIGKQLTRIEQERIKLRKQQQQTLTKSLVVEERSNVILQKGKLLLQQQTKELKLLLVAKRAQQGSTQQLNAVVAILNNRLSKVNQTTLDGKKKADLLRSSIDRLNSRITAQGTAMSKQKRNIGNYTSALAGVGTKAKMVAMQFAGALGLTSVVFLFVNVLKNAFGTIRGFTKENAVLAGVLGKTRKEVEQLTEQAVNLGSVYPILASEVTKLQVSYARLGFTQSDIINLTEATILGSIALNSELDKTATLVGAVVKAYQDLGTADASKIIDQLTRATQISSQSFVTLETALPKVAGAANALNVPLSKTLSLLGIAQDATLDASIAGTSLRNIFLEIAKKGITLEQALGQIRTSSNRLVTSYDLFGKRAAIVGLALANNIELIDTFDTSLQNAGGTAEKVAKEQMETLDGSILSVASSWEKLILGFRESEGFLSAFFKSLALSLDIASDKYLNTIQKVIAGTGVEELWGAPIKKQLAFQKWALTKIQSLDEESIQMLIDKNKKYIEKDKEFEKDFMSAVDFRIKQIEKNEIESEKRKKLAKQQAELEKIALEKEAIAKRENELEIAAKKEADIEKKLSIEKEKLILKERKLRLENAEERIDLDQEIFDEAEKFIDDELKLIEDAALEEIDIEKNKNQKILDNVKEFAEKEKEVDKELLDAKKETAIDGVNTLFALAEGSFNKKLERLEQEKQIELSNDQLTTEQREKLDADYEIRRQKIQQEKKNADKIQAIAEIGINTAKTVGAIKLKVLEMKAAAALNPLLLPLIPIVAAQIPFAIISGALSAAAVAAYEDGTTNAPSDFVAGETKNGGSKRELVATRSGQVYLAEKPTRFKGNQFKGATVFKNEDTEKIMSQTDHSGFGQRTMTDERILNGLSSVEKAIKNKPIQIVDKDYRTIGLQQNNHREIYLNRLRYGK